MIIYITGASGYLGKALTVFFSEKGDTVVALCRKNVFKHNNVVFSKYSLGDDIDKSLPKPDVCIHCAYDLSLLNFDKKKNTNVLGSKKLFDELSKLGCSKLIYVSSFSAFEGCKSEYGKLKLLIEKEALALNGIVIRPGLIYGGSNEGLIGKLSAVVNKNSILPLIGTGAYTQYLTQIDDLLWCLFKITYDELPKPEAAVVLANKNPLTFKEVLRKLSPNNIYFVPVPWLLIFRCLQAIELITNKLPFRSDSVLGLVFSNNNPDFSYIIENNVNFRSLDTN